MRGLNPDHAVGVEAAEVRQDLVARGLRREGEGESVEPGQTGEVGIVEDVAG